MSTTAAVSRNAGVGAPVRPAGGRAGTEPALRPGRRWATIAVGALTAAVLAACGSGGPAPPDSSGLEWRPCAGAAEDAEGLRDAECAELVVPRDRSRPDGPSFTLPVLRLRATGEHRIGSLVINPGGPGISGVDYLRTEGDSLSTLRDRYDLVSFDPRGVGGSDPSIDCLDEAQEAEIRDRPSVPVDPEDERAAIDSARTIAESCRDRFGDWLAHVGTADVVQDLEQLRIALGEDRLTYLGFSYGTYLGARYAATHPDRTGRMVLDGAMDPSLDYDGVRRDQAVAMDRALGRFVADCQLETNCPLEGDVADGLDQLERLVRTLDRQPYTGPDGRRLSGGRALALLQSATYFPPRTWDGLRGVLGDALAGRFQPMLELAHGPALMVNPADTEYLAVLCHDLETSSSTDDLQRLAAEWRALAPIDGPSRAWGTAPCHVWPTRSAEQPAPVRAVGAGPILVIGTTHDPATPVGWARALAGQLDTSHYVEWEGDGHLAYGRAGPCVNRTVEQFLLEGVDPPRSTTCPAEGG